MPYRSVMAWVCLRSWNLISFIAAFLQMSPNACDTVLGESGLPYTSPKTRSSPVMVVPRGSLKAFLSE